MAVLNPGNSTVRSTTYEGALLELVMKYRTNRKPTPSSTITVNVSNNAENVFVTALMPISLVVTDTGTVTTSVIDETSDDFDWTPDATSDIKAATLPAQIFALASKVQLATPVTTDNIDRVTLNLNTDSKIATLNLNFILTQDPNGTSPLALDVAPYVADIA